MDFTLHKYVQLLETLLLAGYGFKCFREYSSLSHKARTVFLRHDIDARPENALAMAREEHALGIRGTYYFRNRSSIFKENIIRTIEELGHEIGYHYENMADAEGDVSRAYEDFVVTLSRFRQIAMIETICMHGSPLSKWNNIRLWDSCDYSNLGILLEAFKDISYKNALYLTDTGRTWSGGRSNIRDTVFDSVPHTFKRTDDIIRDVKNLSRLVFITVHPQRWSNNMCLWTREFVLQNIKNQFKRMLMRRWKIRL